MTKCIVATVAVFVTQMMTAAQISTLPKEHLVRQAKPNVSTHVDSVTFRVLGLMKTKSGAT